MRALKSSERLRPLLPKPYYESGGITIYCGNSEEILPELPQCGLLLTDPPYGLSWNSSSDVLAITPEETEWDTLASSEHIKLCLSKVEHAIVWGGNYLASSLGSWRTPLIWNKKHRGAMTADAEIAWTNFDFGMLRMFDWTPGQEGTRGKKLHPTEKPLALFKWCVERLDVFKYKQSSLTILDPFAGSCTTAAAAKALGRECICIEREEKYCAVGVDRLRQEVLFK